MKLAAAAALATLTAAPALAGAPPLGSRVRQLAQSSGGGLPSNYTAILDSVQQLVESEPGDSFAGVVSIHPMEYLNAADAGAQLDGFYITHGDSNVEHGIKYAKDALFAIGSNTKLHTAVAIYQLQEKGLLSVSDQVADYLDHSDFTAFGLPHIETWCPRLAGSDACEPMTFVNLMEMSSGLVHSFNCDDGPPGATGFTATCLWNSTDVQQYSGAIADYIGIFIDAPLAFTPGTRYSYANSNWQLLAYLVEKLSGSALADYLQHNIYRHVTPDTPGDMVYEPYGGQLGLGSTRVDSYRLYVDAASGDTIAKGTCSPYVSPGLVNGAGGAWATTEAEVDLYRILFTGQRLGGDLLSSKSVEAILRPRQQLAPGSVFYFGQGITVGYSGGEEAKKFLRKEAASAEFRFPDVVTYCGGVDCTSTCIGLTAQGIFTSWSTIEVAAVTPRQYKQLSTMSIPDAYFSGPLALPDVTSNAAAAVLSAVHSMWTGLPPLQR